MIRIALFALPALLMLATAAADQPPVRPGDRIAIVGNTFADQLRIHGYLETQLLLRYRENPVSIRNLGWGGDMLSLRDRPTGFPAEEATLRAHKTDVIIACFGMGESFGGQAKISQFRSDLESFIASHSGKKYNGRWSVRLILVSPIAYEELGDLTPGTQLRNRQLFAYTQAMSEVATAGGVPFVDLFAESKYLMQAPSGPNLTTNGIHLSSYGYWAIHKTLADQLTLDSAAARYSPWSLALDARALVASTSGVEVTNIKLSGSSISFSVTETTPPSLPPPTDQPLPPQLQSRRDMLRVKNLAAGMYRLTIDGQQVLTRDASVWSAGAPIDSSPSHRALEQFRRQVNDKNLQFTYSWKALNQVHIVGQRRSSPSGAKLPQEIIAFNDLANKREEQLAKGVELTTRRWELSPVP